MNRHHVTRVTDPVQAATVAGQDAAMRAVRAGLTTEQAQQAYATAYAATLAQLKAVA